MPNRTTSQHCAVSPGGGGSCSLPTAPLHTTNSLRQVEEEEASAVPVNA